MPDLHVYRLVLHDDDVRRPQPVASCDTDALGFCLLTLREEGQITDADDLGILHRPDGEEHGQWLVNPFTALDRIGASIRKETT